MPVHQKKRAYEKGRPMAATKIGEKRIRKIRVRGGNHKYRALRLNAGNFVWQSEAAVNKTKIISVAFHPSDPEFVRTNTLIKNSIVKIDATPFKNFLIKKYFGVKSDKEAQEFNFNVENWAAARGSDDVKAKLREANPQDAKVLEQLSKGVVLACITSRPGQSGRADGYILEGKELEFYQKKIAKK